MTGADKGTHNDPYMGVCVGTCEGAKLESDVGAGDSLQIGA